MKEEEKKTVKKKITKDSSTKRTSVKKKPVKEIKEIKEETKQIVIEEPINEDASAKKVESKHKYNDKKITLLVIGALIIAIFGVAIGTFVTYYALDGNKKGTVVDATNDEHINKLLKIYNDILNKHYSNLDKNALIEGAIRGMLEETGDPYTSYFDQSEKEAFNERLVGSYIGIGSEISIDKDGNVYFINVFENTPVAKAGIKNGDIITAVNGVSVKGQSTTEVSAKIKGDGKTTQAVLLTYLRDNKEYSVNLTTERISIPSVFTEIKEVAGKKIGYINITIFAGNTAGQYLKALAEMEKANISGLIIDVRNNSGGYLSTVEDMLQNSLPTDSVMYQTKSKTGIEKFYANPGKKINVPIVILQNSVSASGSEMLSVAYKDVYNAKIVGTTSFGKGTVQGVETLPDGTMYKYTIKEWLSPNGNSINKVGIKADINIEMDEKYYQTGDPKDDNQLQKALTELTK